MQTLLSRSKLIKDILYNKTYTSIFHVKLESIQYHACLALTEALRIL